jgi:hypothetical protein
LKIENEIVPEEELVMSFMLTQLEMEFSLSHDYDSIENAVKNLTVELKNGILEFDEKEKHVFIYYLNFIFFIFNFNF